MHASFVSRAPSLPASSSPAYCPSHLARRSANPRPEKRYRSRAVVSGFVAGRDAILSSGKTSFVTLKELSTVARAHATPEIAESSKDVLHMPLRVLVVVAQIGQTGCGEAYVQGLLNALNDDQRFTASVFIHKVDSPDQPDPAADFASVLDAEKPDLVHFQAVGSSCVSLPGVAKRHGCAVVVTFHGMPDEGSVPDDDAVDFIIAPSLHLRARLASELGLPASKLIHLDFGFANATDLRRRARAPEAPGVGFVFGFNAAAAGDLEEGAGVLLEAFQRTAGALPAARLRVWGCGDPGLAQRYAADSRIEWLPALGPSETTEKALNRCDCVVVPSPRWTAGSSLAAHEAAHARVPVIAAAAAGLDEYVQEGVNGLTFGAGDAESLRSVLQAAAGDPAGMAALGRRGFLPSKLGDVAAMPVHVERVANVYYAALGKLRDEAAAATAAAGVAARARRAMLSLRPRGLVRRVTFGTNRDTCNYSCVMCEDHAPDSPRKLGIRSGAIKRDAEMPPALIPQLIAESQGLGLEEVIPATMGEPTMYTHFDEAFLHPLLQPSNHGEPALAGAGGGDGGGGGGGRLVRLNMTTNGSFPISAARGGPERFIEKLVKVGSDVKVSFNSTDPEIQKRVMVGADPDAMMNNVKLLVAARDREAAAGGNYMGITLQCTFMEMNTPTIPDMIRWAAQLGLDRVKGNQLWTHDRGPLNEQSFLRSAEARVRWNKVVGECVAAQRDTPRPDGSLIRIDGFTELPLEETGQMPADYVCPFLQQPAKLWVASDGKVSPCCAPIELRNTLGDFGNVADGGLLNILLSEPYQARRRSRL